jgi:hypothetical protein
MSTQPHVSQAAVPAVPPAPARIKRLTLTDFRAFPGPAPTVFELEGKNLLVYGENGAGKSSLFHALSGFFSFKPARSLREHKNVFSGLPDTECKVAIEFSDGGPAVEWTVGRHPASLRGTSSDLRVTEAALRRACLDYRALLDTNYKQGNGPINLFEIAVEHLLRDYPVTVAGGTSTTIGELWAKVLGSKPSVHTSAAITRINQACVEFNTAFRGALPALIPLVNELMQLLGWQEVELKGFNTPGLTYNNVRLKQNRAVEGQTLSPELSFRNHPLQTPQLFLNEARLSALGLAIYLAGRLACTPTASNSALKLLVLDDVLIGLDHSNRLPVLDVLQTKFADWQVLLLTHDRVWFEMTRFYLGNTGHWKCLEIFEGKDATRGILVPIVRAPGDKAARASLDQARAFLTDHYIPAAANYTRAAFELALKSFCERFGVPVAFKTDPRHLDTDKLMSAVERWFNTHSAKGCMAGIIERVKLFRKVVLNPYSHAAPPNIARTEVEGAIAAVEQLLAAIDIVRMEGDPIQSTKKLINNAFPPSGDLHAALAYLRVAFFRSLRLFCERKRVSIAFRENAVDVQVLWQAVLGGQAALFLSPHHTLPREIDAERRWLITPVTDRDLAAVTQADLTRLLALLVPGGGDRLIFDTIP